MKILEIQNNESFNLVVKQDDRVLFSGILGEYPTLQTRRNGKQKIFFTVKSESK